MAQGAAAAHLPGPPARAATTPLPTRFKTIHAFGAVAFGVKDSGFSVFLLSYYNLGLGMPAGTVGTALFLALMIDALVDPVLGNLSDRTYTRWGRRLPWLYLSALPLALVWAALWARPWGGEPGFAELLGVAVTVRLLLSASEVNAVALVPELTSDYDERSALFRWRFLFGWTGGLIMLFLAYEVFLTDGPERATGYDAFGIVGGAIILFATLVSALGQHSRVAHLPASRPPPFSLRSVFGEIFEAFANRPFLILMGGMMAAFVSQGMILSLTNYLYLFIWQIGDDAFVLFPLVLFASVVLAFIIGAPLQRRLEKRDLAARCALVATVLWLTPIVLLLVGLWPPLGSTASTAGIFIALLFANAMAILVPITGMSMLADLVDRFAQQSGRRAEGSLYAGNWLVQKASGGVGILIGSQIVQGAGLSSEAEPGSITMETITAMLVPYAIAISVLGALIFAFMRRFPITRADHESRLDLLNDIARAEADPHTHSPNQRL